MRETNLILFEMEMQPFSPAEINVIAGKGNLPNLSKINSWMCMCFCVSVCPTVSSCGCFEASHPPSVQSRSEQGTSCGRQTVPSSIITHRLECDWCSERRAICIFRPRFFFFLHYEAVSLLPECLTSNIRGQGLCQREADQYVTEGICVRNMCVCVCLS